MNDFRLFFIAAVLFSTFKNARWIFWLHYKREMTLCPWHWKRKVLVFVRWSNAFCKWRWEDLGDHPAVPQCVNIPVRVNRTDYRSLASLCRRHSTPASITLGSVCQFFSAKRQCFGFLSSLLNSRRFDWRTNLPLDFARRLFESS